MTLEERLIALIPLMTDEERNRIRRLLDGDEGMSGSLVPTEPSGPDRPPLQSYPGINDWPERFRRRRPIPMTTRPFVEPLTVDGRWVEPLTVEPMRMPLPGDTWGSAPSTRFEPPSIVC